jgi:hypothetical protein
VLSSELSRAPIGLGRWGAASLVHRRHAPYRFVFIIIYFFYFEDLPSRPLQSFSSKVLAHQPKIDMSGSKVIAGLCGGFAAAFAAWSFQRMNVSTKKLISYSL